MARYGAWLGLVLAFAASTPALARERAILALPKVEGVPMPASGREAKRMEEFALTLPPQHRRPWLARVLAYREKAGDPLALLVTRGEYAAAALVSRQRTLDPADPERLRAVIEVGGKDGLVLSPRTVADRRAAALAMAGLADGWIALGEEEQGYPLLRHAIGLLVGSKSVDPEMAVILRRRLAQGLADLPKGAGLAEARALVDANIAAAPANPLPAQAEGLMADLQLQAALALAQDPTHTSLLSLRSMAKALSVAREVTTAQPLASAAAQAVASRFYADCCERYERSTVWRDAADAALLDSRTGPGLIAPLAASLVETARADKRAANELFGAELQLRVAREIYAEGSRPVIEATLDLAEAFESSRQFASARTLLDGLLENWKGQPAALKVRALAVRSRVAFALHDIDAGRSDSLAARSLMVEGAGRPDLFAHDAELVEGLIANGRNAEALKLIGQMAGSLDNPEDMPRLNRRLIVARLMLKAGDLAAAIGLIETGWHDPRTRAAPTRYRHAFSVLAAECFEGEEQAAAGERWRRSELELAEQIVADDQESFEDAITHLAYNLDKQGRQSDAVALMKKYVELAENGGGDFRMVANRRLELAHYLTDIGRDGEGQVLLQRIFDDAMAKGGPKSSFAINAATNLGGHALTASDPASALPAIDAVIAAGALDDPEYGSVLSFLRAQIVVLLAMRDQAPVAQARSAIEQARSIAQKQNKKVNVDGASEMLGFDGFTFLEANLDGHEGNDAAIVGRFAKALSLCVGEGEQIAELATGCASAYASVAEPLVRTGDFIRAVPASSSVLASAEAEYRRLLARDELSRARIETSAAVADFGDFGIYLDALKGAADQGREIAADERERAFSAIQRISASRSETAMASSWQRLAESNPELASLLRQRQKLAEQVSQAAQKPGADPDDPAEKATEEELLAVSRQLAARFPAFANIDRPRLATLAEAQARLKPDEALLVIGLGLQRAHTFAVSPAGIAWSETRRPLAEVATDALQILCEVDSQKCPGDAQAAARQVTSTVGGSPFDVAAANRLYEDLIAPVARTIEGARTVYVVVDPTFSDLALPMLVTSFDPQRPSQTRWLADRFAFVTLPSVGALLIDNPGAAGRVDGTLVGYGDPVLAGHGLEDTDRGGFSFTRSADGFQLSDVSMLRKMASLPGSRVELAAAARLFEGGAADLRLASDATESRVKTDPALSRADVVMFSTHGLLPGDIAGLVEPGLVFTPPDTVSATDDGLLTASEAALLQVRADMVLLSACNTASSSKARISDSLSGLARAFLYAGSRSLVASRWRVDDKATAALTVELLANRRSGEGLTRAQALQRAMQAVRRGYREDGSRVEGWSPAWAHPAKWAAFSLISNRDE